MFFVVGSVPFAIFASFGAASNIMLMFFMAVHAGWPDKSKLHFMPEVALGVLTLLGLIIMSWDSFKASVRDCSAMLVNSGSRCCERLDASVALFFENQWARLRVYFRGLFGAVNPTQEDLELARLDRNV
ncbi:hypothetical protein CTI12_AA341540 [Artemisia annua]|uniref:Uncharacterized protein n=1 Tax=Artemisia annua TaxID=35608 RepID=A0A2U1MUE1_ARTAN|nr:hypothetical protein CTI12_AA341540 [Artemisia annua]